MLGIPLAVAGLPLLFLAPWYYGVGAIVVGYFLQWVGTSRRRERRGRVHPDQADARAAGGGDRAPVPVGDEQW